MSRRPAVAQVDLDTQIAQVEQQLVAREAWILDTSAALAQRAQAAATPRPWLLPVAGAGAVLWLGWRWWHRGAPVRPATVLVPMAAVAQPAASRLADLPWAGLTALAWPLLPVAWRARISPAAATAAVSTAVSLSRRLLRRRAR